jgi:CBS domain-containing protein
MNQNKIAERVADFLIQFPPFSYLNTEDLYAISSTVKIEFYPKGKIVFHENVKPEAYFFVLRKGEISLKNGYKSNKEYLYDTCEEGDIFGIRSLFAGDVYRSTAIAAEDSILYLVENYRMQTLLQKYPSVTLFFAADFASGVNINSNAIEKNVSTRKLLSKMNLEDVEDDENLSVFNAIQPLISTLKSTKIKVAATLMSSHDIGSILIVDEFNFPVGIVTDKDLRKKVATGIIATDVEIEKIMSSPVITANREITYSKLTYLMMKNKIRHVCITENGTNQSPSLGVISISDLSQSKENQPVAIIKNILKSNTINELKKAELQIIELLKLYETKDVSIQYVCDVIGFLRQELFSKTIELSKKEIFKTASLNSQVSFFVMGSFGRNEQFTKSDQDNFLVYQLSGSTDKSIISLFANKIVKNLNEIGFEYCQAQMMANNEKWCLSDEEWKQTIQNWILFPTPENVLNTSIFFDFKLVNGDTKIELELKNLIFDTCRKNNNFLRALADDALKTPPPLSFFNRFIVEKDGNHQDSFDLKARALLPFTDAARVLALFYSISDTSTIQRFERLIEVDDNNKVLYKECIFAFELLLKLRLKFSLKNSDTGRYIPIEKLNKIEKQTLKHVFSCLSELQNILKVKFNLGY